MKTLFITFGPDFAIEKNLERFVSGMYSEIAEFSNGIIHLGSLCLVWLPVQGHEQELGNGGIKLKTTLKEILIQKADICTVFGFVEFLKIKKKYRKIKIIICYNCLHFYHNQSFVPVQCSILVFPVLLSRNSVSKRSQNLGLWPRTYTIYSQHCSYSQELGNEKLALWKTFTQQI